MSANKLSGKVTYLFMANRNHINNLETIINNCFLKVISFTAKPYVSGFINFNK